MINIPRIIVIGAGAHATKVHLPILKKLSDKKKCSLVCVVDIDSDRAKEAQKRFSFEAYETDPHAIETYKDINLVYVFGTAYMHYEYAKIFLSKGIAVCIEKPLTENSIQLRELVELARVHKTNLFCGLNRRYMTVVEDVKGYLLDSKISTIEAKFNYNFYGIAPKFEAPSWISSNSIHALDLILFFKKFEKPIQVSSIGNALQGGKNNNFVSILKWEDSTSAVFISNNESGVRQEQYTIHAEDATYIFDRSSLEIWRSGSLFLKKEYTKDKSGFEQEHEYFLSQLENHIVDDSVVGTLELCESIEAGHINITQTSKSIQTEKQKEHSKPANSILVLNPSGMRAELSRMRADYTILYEEDLQHVSTDDRKNIVAIITGNKGKPLTADMLNTLPSVKVVGIVGASIKKFDPQFAIERGITVFNASKVFAETVAEFITMYAILGMRRASLSHEVIRRGGWGIEQTSFLSKVAKRLRMIKNTNTKTFVNTQFRGATFGMIGFGEVTTSLIEILKMFDCKIHVYSDYLTSEQARELGVEKVSLTKAMQADVVSVHRGQSQRTLNSITKNELSYLKQGAVFINASRGQVVNTEDLILRLKKGDVFACLDVFDVEPLPKSSPLRKMKNVFLTSHIAGGTQAMHEKSVTNIYDTVTEFLVHGKHTENKITLERLANMT